MDQRIEAFLADVLALAGEDLDAIREGVRVALADCEAIFRLQEPKKRMRDQAAQRLPRIVLLSRRRGNASTPRNADRRALEAGAQHHRPAGALSCPSAALWLPEIGKGAVHASLAMATAPIVLV